MMFIPHSLSEVQALVLEDAALLHAPAGSGFLSTFQKWREDILLKQAPPVVFADLGNGVLDSAMVEVAAYCLEKKSRGLAA